MTDTTKLSELARTCRDAAALYKRRVAGMFMLVSPDKISSKLAGKDFCVTRKLDGMLAYASCADGEIAIFGTGGRDLSSVPVAKTLLADLKKAKIKQAEIVCELYAIAAVGNRSRVGDVVSGLADSKKAAFAWTLEAEDGSEISSGTRRCYLEDILDEDDMEEDVSYTDNDYVLMFYEYVKGTQASFEVPADINMEEIKFIPNKLMCGKFKKDKMYYKAFGKKSSSLICFQYKDKWYSSDDYDGCDSYGIEAYILIKYDAKERSWKVINYMQA